MTSGRAFDGILWAAALALLVSVLVLSLGPGAGPSPIFGTDKLWHGVAYGVLTASWLLAAVWRPGRGPGPLPHASPAVAFGAALYGGVVELLQLLVGRSADPFDWLANLAGIAAALGAWRLLRRGASRS